MPRLKNVWIPDGTFIIDSGFVRRIKEELADQVFPVADFRMQRDQRFVVLWPLTNPKMIILPGEKIPTGPLSGRVEREVQ